MPKPPLNLDERLKRSQGRMNRTQNVQARFTPEEEQQLKAAAKAQGLFLSEWVREVLLAQAKTEFPPMAIFTELVALRAVVDKFLGPVAIGQKLTKELAQQIVAEIKEGKHNAAKTALEQYINPLGDKG